MSANLELVTPRVVPMRPAAGMFNVPGCSFTPTALIIKRGMPIDDWVELGKILRKAGDSVQIWVGDWIRYGKHEYGKKYDAALALTGYKKGTLRDSVWVANAVPVSARADILTFRHYRVVARLPTTREIRKWLRKAVKGDSKKIWSAAKLKHEIQKASQPPAPKSILMQELKKLHDKVVREELGEKITVATSWLETPADPLLSTVYRRVIEILEWQRTRTIETDCMAIMKIFTGDEGTDGPDRATDGYIAAWLRGHGLIMGDDEMDDRLQLMVRIKMLTVDTREDSRQDGRKGVITAVYAPEIDYLGKLDEISGYPTSDRPAALRKDWAARVQRYAPELVPEKDKENKAA